MVVEVCGSGGVYICMVVEMCGCGDVCQWRYVVVVCGSRGVYAWWWCLAVEVYMHGIVEVCGGGVWQWRFVVWCVAVEVCGVVCGSGGVWWWCLTCSGGVWRWCLAVEVYMHGSGGVWWWCVAVEVW